MKSRLVLLSFMSVLALGVAASLVMADARHDGGRNGRDDDDDRAQQNDPRVQRGLEISPVKPDFDDHNRNLNLTDQDLKAIYGYLSAIPHAEPGSCSGAGD
jgi:hypothetical protein